MVALTQIDDFLEKPKTATTKRALVAIVCLSRLLNQGGRYVLVNSAVRNARPARGEAA